MEFIELAKNRYSVRKFKEEKISEENINKILEAGMLAPTACNNQPQRILVINSNKGLETLKKVTECHYNAPLAFIILYNKDECWKRSYDNVNSGYVDSSIVTSFMMMEAESLNIKTTWVMYFIKEAVMKEFNIDSNLEPVAILVAGYEDDNYKPSPKHFINKDKKEIVEYK